MSAFVFGLFKENLLATLPPFYRVISQNITALSDGQSSKFTSLKLVLRVWKQGAVMLRVINTCSHICNTFHETLNVIILSHRYRRCSKFMGRKDFSSKTLILTHLPNATCMTQLISKLKLFSMCWDLILYTVLIIQTISKPKAEKAVSWCLSAVN